MVASSDLVLGAAKRVGASDNEAGATNERVDAAIEKADASEKNQEWTTEEVQ